MMRRIGCLLTCVAWLGCAGYEEDQELVSSLDEEIVEIGGAPSADVEIIDKTPRLEDYPQIADACHGDVTCSGVTSCTNWSSTYDCDGGTCRFAAGCCEPFAKSPGGEIDPLICNGINIPGFFQNREQFRVCFYVDGSQCMEFNQFQSLEYCGC